MPTLKFARLVNDSGNSDLAMSAPSLADAYAPVSATDLLNGLLNLIQKCGTSLSPEQTTVAVMLEVSRWEVADGDGPKPQEIATQTT